MAKSLFFLLYAKLFVFQLFFFALWQFAHIRSQDDPFRQKVGEAARTSEGLFMQIRRRRAILALSGRLFTNSIYCNVKGEERRSWQQEESHPSELLRLTRLVCDPLSQNRRQRREMQHLSKVFCSNLHLSGQIQQISCKTFQIPQQPWAIYREQWQRFRFVPHGLGRAGCNYVQNQMCVTALINGNTLYQSNGTTQQKQLRHRHFLPTADDQGSETIIHSSLFHKISVRESLTPP